MERYEVPPERLGRWLERWAAATGPVTRTVIGPREVTFHAERGTLACEPPFPPVQPRGEVEGFAVSELHAHVERERRVGVVLVRLGGAAVGVFAGRQLLTSKVETRLVHGRHRAGGSSARRFERRRLGQGRVMLEAAADVTARIVLPHAAALDAVVLGGDRSALATVMEDVRLAPLAALAVERVLDVPDPRLAVLRETPEKFLATVLRPQKA